jgi:hypothetical protein
MYKVTCDINLNVITFQTPSIKNPAAEEIRRTREEGETKSGTVIMVQRSGQRRIGQI